VNKCTNLSRAARAIARGIRLLCRRSQRKNASAPLPVYCSLRSLCILLAPLAEAGAWSRCLPHSLADERRVCSLDRPGQRRASLAQHGGARFPTLAAELVADARS
jgi:hypothetical protein